MRIHLQIKCWRVVGVVSAVTTISVIAEPLHVPAPPLPPGAEAHSKMTMMPPPLPPSPVENFRFWLNLSSAERSPLLSRMPDAQRKALEAKLASYDALSPDAQNLRLRETELHWQLLALMKLPADQRQSRLAQFSPNERQLVQERLKQWDALSAANQKTFLDNEEVVGVYLELQETPPHARSKVLASMSPEVRFPLEQRLQKWNNLPAPQRQELSDRFSQLFQLPDRDKEKVVATLLEAARMQVEKISESLKNLPPDERKRCTAALNKFLKMSAEDQNRFLQNAMRWQKMSEKEHAAWRQVVNTAPILPPL
ncbi:MAG: hypothetical protein JWO95_2428, partial [Verrucomicrobiales bacterium]|nr:hypothetical protein [Verrucomicrobiales bacterium]